MISFIKKNILTICCVAVIVMMVSAGDAFAQTTVDLMGTAKNKAANVFTSVKQIVFVVGGFGLVALAFMAIFGKLDWKKFAMLAVGLAILAAAGAVVDYATGADEGSKLKDTFKESDGYGSR